MPGAGDCHPTIGPRSVFVKRRIQDDRVTAVGPGDLLFAAAHVAHGFEDFSEDFAIWIVFYGPVK